MLDLIGILFFLSSPVLLPWVGYSLPKYVLENFFYKKYIGNFVLHSIKSFILNLILLGSFYGSTVFTIGQSSQGFLFIILMSAVIILLVEIMVRKVIYKNDIIFPLAISLALFIVSMYFLYLFKHILG